MHVLSIQKTSVLSQIFQHDWKFQDFAIFHPSQVLSGQKCQFWAKFSMWLLMSAFCQILAFPGPEWSKINVNFDPNFKRPKRDWNFWILPNFTLPRSKWSKISFSSQIFNTAHSFLILPSFIFCTSRVVKIRS